MAQISVTDSEFENIIMCHILDAIINDDIGVGNSEFRDFIDTIKNRGMKPILLQKVISMDQGNRFDYKRIRGALSGSQKTSTVIVNYKEKIPENKPSKILPKLALAGAAALAKTLIKKSSKNPEEDDKKK